MSNQQTFILLSLSIFLSLFAQLSHSQSSTGVLTSIEDTFVEIQNPTKVNGNVNFMQSNLPLNLNGSTSWIKFQNPGFQKYNTLTLDLTLCTTARCGDTGTRTGSTINVYYCSHAWQGLSFFFFFPTFFCLFLFCLPFLFSFIFCLQKQTQTLNPQTRQKRSITIVALLEFRLELLLVLLMEEFFRFRLIHLRWMNILFNVMQFLYFFLFFPFFF